MTKKIRIDCCDHCQLKEIITPSHGVVICTHTETYGAFIDDVSTIPDWCMLEDEDLPAIKVSAAVTSEYGLNLYPYDVLHEEDFEQILEDL